MRMFSLADERSARVEAMAWLAARTCDGAEPITRQQLTQFVYEGERLTLIDRGRGIRKPAGWRAPLTIMTSYVRPGAERPYADMLGDDAFPRYKLRADSGGSAENRALGRAVDLELPMIWLVGVAPGVYQTVFPVYAIGIESDQVVLAYDAAQELPVPASPGEATMRRYMLRENMVRLHQPVFRSTVVQAYRTRCAVCALGHAELLDAAHIRPDAEGGQPTVENGLALCKIHHAAYDSNILGISPEYRVAIRGDILEEVDGPLLEHGLKALHRRELMVLPSSRAARPDRDLLRERFTRFLAA